MYAYRGQRICRNLFSYRVILGIELSSSGVTAGVLKSAPTSSCNAHGEQSVLDSLELVL